jgi:hypothetical protein
MRLSRGDSLEQAIDRFPKEMALYHGEVDSKSVARSWIGKSIASPPWKREFLSHE